MSIFQKVSFGVGNWFNYYALREEFKNINYFGVKK